MNSDSPVPDTEQDSLQDHPLLTQTPLIDVPAVPPRRKPHHWALFVASCFLAFAPLLGGLVFGVVAIVGAISPSGLFPWWAGLFGLVLIIFCLSGPIMGIYGITELDRTALWMSLIFAVLSWPGVALAIFVLTYVAPEQPVKAELCTSSAVENPATDNCIWD